MRSKRDGQSSTDELSIDVNSDVGELADPSIDEALMGLISSANIACGGHAGDRSSMLRICHLATEHDVAVGAQVSYPDTEGFGRRRLDIAPAALRDSLDRQFSELADAAERASTRVSYVKPHGALYHAAIDDPAIADIIIDLAADHDVSLLTLGIGHLRDGAVRAEIPVFHEAFLDRGYTDDGRLVPRDHPQALLGADAVVTRLRGWIQSAFHGAHSLCVHSDTPEAVHMTRHVRQTLREHGVTVRPFITGSPRR